LLGLKNRPMVKLLEDLKFFLEKIDHFRDQLLFVFIKKFWPEKILPNHLSWLRIFVGAGLFVFLFFGVESKLLIISLFVFGALTDLLDGSVARFFKEETKFGAFLDPLADRILLAPIAFYSLFFEYKTLLFALIAMETINALTSSYLHSKNIFVQTNIFGKTKMVLQSFVFVVILVIWPNPLSGFFIDVLWVSAIFVVLSIFTTLNDPVNKNLIKEYAKNKNI